MAASGESERLPSLLVIHFADCEYAREARELRRAGAVADLTPKAFDLLGILLERRPRVVGKDELRDRLWPDSFVGDSSVAKLVTELRHAIGDDTREPRFIRTIHRHGYAFCGEAAALATPREPEPARVFPCTLLWGADEIGLGEGDNFIGRAADCVVRIDSSKVSRHHARIRVARGGATVEDLGSKNGTFLRGKRIAAATVLVQGDDIRIGPVTLTFSGGYGPGSTETA